jgi:fructose-1,6-bisphosphatase/sedoheptulose 1,7-bisphosphatase-like protein
VEAYRIVVEAFAGLGGIPEGAITRAAVRVVEAPEEAKSLAARIRDKKFI